MVTFAPIDTNGSTVRVTLTNTSGAALRIPRYNVPWYRVNSTIVAVGSRSHQTVAQDYDLFAAPPGEVTLRPNASLTEDIDVASWFPALQQRRRSEDVIVFWAYELRPIDAPRAEFYGGIRFSKIP